MKKVLVTDWCLIEIGYLVSPLEDSSYFAFKILEVLIHTSLVLKIPSYFDEYSRELLPKSRTVPQIRHSFSQMPENYSIANPQILVTCPPPKKTKIWDPHKKQCVCYSLVKYNLKMVSHFHIINFLEKWQQLISFPLLATGD